MTTSQIDLLRRAIELLRRIVPDHGEIHAVDLPTRRCPVAMFAKKFLERDPTSDLTSAELWQFYAEVAASGELERLSRSQFLRRLPQVLELTFGVKKCHSIERDGHRVRGFRGINLNEQA